MANLVERLSIIKANQSVTLADLPDEYQYMVSEESAEAGEYSPVVAEDPDRPELIEGSDGLYFQVEEAVTDEVLERVLMRFSRSMLAVALDDALEIDSIAADRLSLSPQEFSVRRRELGL